jgi:hypothetical protein
MKDRLLMPQLDMGLFYLDLEDTNGLKEDDMDPNDVKRHTKIDTKKFMPKLQRLKLDYSFLPQISPDG